MLSRKCVFRFLYKQNNTSIQSKITANHSTGPVLNLPTPNKNHVRYVSLTWISRNCVIPNLSLFCNMQWQLETQHAKFGDCAISFDRIIANLNWWVPAWKYHFLAYFHFQTLFYILYMNISQELRVYLLWLIFFGLLSGFSHQCKQNSQRKFRKTRLLIN